jgi:uncharacterized membrane protein YhaH (DUF805 family)
VADERPRPQYGEYASPDEQLLAGGTAVPATEAPPTATGRGIAGRGPGATGPFPPPLPGTRITGDVKRGDVRSGAGRTGALLAPGKRSFDTFMTTFVLSITALVVISSSGGWVDLPATLIQTYDQLGYGEFTSIELAATMGTVIAVTQSVLLIAAAVISIVRLRARRSSYWVPLVFGVVSIVVTFILMMIVMMSDPALAAYLATQR